MKFGYKWKLLHCIEYCYGTSVGLSVIATMTKHWVLKVLVWMMTTIEKGMTAIKVMKKMLNSTVVLVAVAFE
jgi:hypothetical protein